MNSGWIPDEFLMDDSEWMIPDGFQMDSRFRIPNGFWMDDSRFMIPDG